MSEFKTPLDVRLIEDGRWRILAPLVYQSDYAGIEIVVPVGFETDFASIPKIPGVFELLAGKANMAATVHDYLYTSHITDRLTADHILAEAARVTGINRVGRHLLFDGVRLGGASHWGR